MKAMNKNLVIIVFALMLFCFAFGYFIGVQTILSSCTEKSYRVFNNRIVLQCKVEDINAVLERNYSDRPL